MIPFSALSAGIDSSSLFRNVYKKPREGAGKRERESKREREILRHHAVRSRAHAYGQNEPFFHGTRRERERERARLQHSESRKIQSRAIYEGRHLGNITLAKPPWHAKQSKVAGDWKAANSATLACQAKPSKAKQS
jgi:hypothetical protein